MCKSFLVKTIDGPNSAVPYVLQGEGNISTGTVPYALQTKQKEKFDMYGGVPSVVLYGVVAQPIPYGADAQTSSQEGKVELGSDYQNPGAPGGPPQSFQLCFGLRILVGLLGHPLCTPNLFG
ncbi:uncharacterized protein LOC111713952 [Eurytemora carolleeae]|uniref:uncharacterized protein LOC111713952 n=1 Tax=Eurytemora carolleeae TaxID=1294199 RepID=UPI000C773D2A|nr:uncharacterized protein LOC111713952 [Eurytemora carolleeae]|eukprot:XP_023344719.1 uncharacterized protein LOC111713952 [Eurytemora affinis]